MYNSLLVFWYGSNGNVSRTLNQKRRCVVVVLCSYLSLLWTPIHIFVLLALAGDDVMMMVTTNGNAREVRFVFYLSRKKGDNDYHSLFDLREACEFHTTTTFTIRYDRRATFIVGVKGQSPNRSAITLNKQSSS